MGLGNAQNFSFLGSFAAAEIALLLLSPQNKRLYRPQSAVIHEEVGVLSLAAVPCTVFLPRLG